MEQAYATTVALDGRGVMLLGPSGSGKSDLALRLIDGGAALVADDRTDLRRDGGQVIASAPDALAGRIEIRGYDIVELPFVKSVPLCLVVELVAGDIDRMPDAMTATILGQSLPLVRLHAFEASAVARIKLILKTLES